MKHFRLALLSLLAVLLPPPVQAGPILSTFDQTAEGWTALTASGNVFGVPATGATPVLVYNPSGFILVDDIDSEDTFFRAPSAFLGNQSYAFNGNLTFSLFTNPNGGTNAYSGPTVVLKGAGMTLIYALPTQPAIANQWVNVSVPLAPGAFWGLNSWPGGPQPNAAQFQAVLSNLQELWISGETIFGIVETSGLDNVHLPSAADIPEPSPAVFAGIGALALGVLRVRRSKQGPARRSTNS